MSLLRTSYTATHRREHLDKALGILADVGRKLDLIPAEGEGHKVVASEVNLG
jgi:hypothetical protein